MKALAVVVLSVASCAAPARAPAPAAHDEITLRAGYLVDELMTSEVVVTGDGAFQLTTRGDDGGGTIHERICKGFLDPRIHDDLVSALAAEKLVPDGETPPVQAPRDQDGLQARYSSSVRRGDASLVPADEASARRLVPFIRNAISWAETEAQRGAAKCSPETRSRRGER
jgi:hypothetical protein